MTKGPETVSLRDEIARIIDPLAWELFDEVVRCQLLPQGEGPPAELLNDASRDAKVRTDESLRKTDSILSLLPPKGWRPSREDVAHALTRRKSIYEKLASDRDPFGEATDNAHDRAIHGVEVMEHIEAEILALFDAAPVTKTE